MASVSGLIDKVIDELTMYPVKRFYPTYVEKCTGLPLKTVFEYLLDLVNANKLELKWEVCCPNYGCAHTVTILDTLPLEVGTTVNCSVCGDEVEITENNLRPIFLVNEEYKESRQAFWVELKKKKREITPVLTV
ncbi:MAG: hypothetical protein H6Q75_1554 [Firmicutes bacterium]|nr:hypothetical protein [Bacillota bacterium]